MILCDADDLNGASWGPDDMIFFVPSWVSGLWKVSAAGGTPQIVANPDIRKKERGFLWPDILPGNKAVLLTVFSGGGPDDAQIVVQPLPTGERRTLIQGGTCARYLPTGHIVYARSGSLFAVPFDATKLQVTGSPVAVVEGITTKTSDFSALYSFSQNGSLIYVPGTLRFPERNLVWVNRKGQTQSLTDTVRPYGNPRLSPDGKQVATLIEAATYDVWTYDIMTCPRFEYHQEC